MIKLKNIVIENDIAKSDIIPEDCKTYGKIEVDLSRNEIINSVLPTGYECCKNHLQHAKDYLIEIAKTRATSAKGRPERIYKIIELQ